MGKKLILLLLAVLTAIGVITLFDRESTEHETVVSSDYSREQLDTLRTMQDAINSHVSDTVDSIGSYEIFFVENATRADSILAGNREYVDLGGDDLRLPLTTPIDWDQSLEENRSLNFQLNAWSGSDSLLAAFDQNNDIALFNQAAAIALDWAQTYQEPLPNGSPGFAWYDMAVGTRIYQLAYMLEYSFVHDTLTDEQEALLWDSLIDHFEYLSKESNIIYHNNHGIFQAAGQSAAARRFAQFDTTNTLASIGVEASERLNRLFETQFSDEGIQLEHSPAYHIAVYATLANLHAAGIFSEAQVDRLALIEDNIAWLTLPSGRLLNFGDSDSETDLAQETDLFAGSHNGFALAQGYEPWNISPLAVFENSGWLIYKEGNTAGDSYFAYSAAFHSRTHKHADDQSFVWSNQLGDILIDAGRYGYIGKTVAGSEAHSNGFWYADPKRQYIETTRAHNALEIDGLDQVRKGREPFGSAIRSHGTLKGPNGTEIIYVSSSVDYSATLSHERTVLTAPDDWLVVVDRPVETGDFAHTYRQWFQLGPEFTLTPSSPVSYRAESGAGTVFITSLSDNSGSVPTSAEEDPILQGWHSTGEQNFLPATSFNFESTSGPLVTLFSVADSSHSLTVREDSILIEIDTLTVQLTHRGNGEIEVNLR